MIDPLMLGVVALSVVGLIAVLSYFFSSKEESDFEKKFQEFNGNALKLLSENGKKDKKQQNQPKPKPEKKKVKKEEPTVAAPVEPSPKVSPKPVEVTPPKKVQQKVEEAEEEEKLVVKKVEKVQSSVEKSPVLSENQQPKKKAGKSVNLRDLDAKKVLARLNNAENLEPEYVQFLTSYFKDTDLQKNNLTNEVKAVQKKLNENVQKVEKMTKEKGSWENRQKEEQLKVANMNAKLQQLFQSEQMYKQQLTTVTATAQRNESTLSNDITALKSRLIEQDKELVAVRSANTKLAREVKAAGMQVNEADVTNFKSTFGNFEQVSIDLKNDILKKKELIDELLLDLNKKDGQLREFENEKQEWIKKEQALKQEYFSVTNTVQTLNGEIDQFVAYKEEQEKVVADLRLKEQELEKYKQEEASKVVEIPKNSPPPKEVEEEIFELKKTNVDLATPSSSRNEEFNKIVEEKERLQLKVDELRARNIAILEKVEEAEKKSTKPSKASEESVQFDIEGERKQVVDTVGKLTNSKFDKLKDTKAYSKWLLDSVSNVEKQLNEARKRPAVIAPVQEVKKEDSGYYREVIKNLLSELARIEKLAA